MNVEISVKVNKILPGLYLEIASMYDIIYAQCSLSIPSLQTVHPDQMDCHDMPFSMHVRPTFFPLFAEQCQYSSLSFFCYTWSLVDQTFSSLMNCIKSLVQGFGTCKRLVCPTVILLLTIPGWCFCCSSYLICLFGLYMPFVRLHVLVILLSL